MDLQGYTGMTSLQGTKVVKSKVVPLVWRFHCIPLNHTMPLRLSYSITHTIMHYCALRHVYGPTYIHMYYVVQDYIWTYIHTIHSMLHVGLRIQL